MSLVENFVAIEQAQGVNLTFMGFLIWYSVSDCRITREQLETVFTETGIDKEYLPKEISPRDAFRRATKMGEEKGVFLAKDRFLNIMVRDVKSDPDQIVRQLVREVVDSEKIRLQYKPVADLIFREGNIHIIPKVDRYPEELAAIERIERTYEVEKECYNGRTMRDIMTDLLTACRPVNVRPSGGVYFIAAKHEVKAEKIKKFASRISEYNTSGHKTTCWTVPVVDAEEQRGMLQESMEDQVDRASKALIEEIAKLTKANRTITQGLANQYVDRAKSLGKLIKEYEDMLEFQSVQARANLELAMQGAMQILDKVEVAS